MQKSNHSLREVTNKEIAAMVERVYLTTRPADAPVIRNFKMPIRKPAELGTLDFHKNNINPLVIDFGIEVGKKKTERGLSTEECNELFGVSQAVKMNFIPQMVNSLMMDQAASLVNYCRDNRVSETKKHTRVIKKAVEEYSERLAEAYGPDALKSYLYYAKRFKEETATDIWLMEQECHALCRNQLPNERHQEIAARVLIIVMLIRFIQKYDKEMDKLIASKINEPVNTRPDAYQQLILAMCISLAEDMGFKIDPSKQMGMWVQVLSNKAWRLADAILAEEGEGDAN